MTVKSPRHKNREGGFVLAELLVAMVVLAIATIAFLQIVQSSAKRIQSIKTDATITRLALNLMNTTRAQTHIDREEQEGQDARTGLYWHVKITPDKDRTSNSAEQPSILLLNVEVWKQGQPPLVLTSAKWATKK